MVIEILLAALAIMLVSLVGVLFIHNTIGRFLEARLPFLVSFSAGVFLVTAGGLALEVLELAHYWWQGAALVAAGYLVAWGVHALLPETHHHHDLSCQRGHGGARKLIIGDALHNMADGIILVPAFLASPALGVAVTVSMLIHETLQEISEYFVLRQSGYSVRRALIINFAVSSTILFGVLLSFIALATAEIEVFLLAFSAGFFLHVVVHDLLPRRHHHHATGHYLRHVLLVVIGFCIMMGIGLVASSEAHLHGDEATSGNHGG